MPEPTEPTRKFTIPVEIDLGFMGKRLVDPGSHDDEPPSWEPLSIEDMVIETAARNLVYGSRSGEDGRDLMREVRERARAIMDEELRSAIKPMIAEAVARGIQPTDGYGQPKGEPKTMSEVLVETAEKVLGRPSNPSSRESRTFVQQIIHDEVERAMDRELKDALTAAKAEVLKAVQEKGAEVLASTIAAMAKP